MAGVGGSKGGKWRQLYLNNNKKCEKKKVNFIWRFKSFILSQHLIYFKIISLEGIQCGLICIKKWQLCFFFFNGSIGSLNQLQFLLQKVLQDAKLYHFQVQAVTQIRL